MDRARFFLIMSEDFIVRVDPVLSRPTVNAQFSEENAPEEFRVFYLITVCREHVYRAKYAESYPKRIFNFRKAYFSNGSSKTIILN